MGWCTNSVFGINWSVTPKCAIITATYSTFIGSLWCSLRYKHYCSSFSVPGVREKAMYIYTWYCLSVYLQSSCHWHIASAQAASPCTWQKCTGVFYDYDIYETLSHQNIMFFDSVKFLFLSSFDRRRKILIDKTDPILSNHFSSRRWLVLWKESSITA